MARAHGGVDDVRHRIGEYNHDATVQAIQHRYEA
jgi:hypothetical protein